MICFGWAGFPQYGARCVRAFVESTDEEVVVVATPPRVPIAGMDEICGCRVVWVPENDPRKLGELLGGRLPRVLTVPGWMLGNYNRYADEVRAAGGRVIAGVDNNFAGFGLKQLLKALRFRLFQRRRFDGFWVPGRAGVRLLRFYGVPETKIFTNLYAADGALFCDGDPLVKRAKRIVYVGQFVARKNVLRMCRAFARTNPGDWTLALYGSGELKGRLAAFAAEQGGRVEVHDFVQPEALAAVYRSARFFCLPSVEEHWGLVVHEAALSGCGLLLSEAVGAAEDMLDGNGRSFDPRNEAEMAACFRAMMRLDGAELLALQKRSVEMAKRNSTALFAESVRRFAE